MIAPDVWIGYGLPLFGIGFGLAGLAVVWIAARRFDARFGTAAPPAPRAVDERDVLQAKP